jgi:MazG family protein
MNDETGDIKAGGDDGGRDHPAAELLELQRVVRVLRRECPWDREQSFEDIVTYTLEETFELIDAVHTGRGDEAAGELGDLLFHVFFLSLLAEENGWSDLSSITRGITEKLIRRHPHVFGEAEVEDAAEVVRRWEDIKRNQEGREGVFHDIPSSLPSTLHAQRLQLRAAAVGFDWDRTGPVFDKIHEEIDELRQAMEEEAGEQPERKRGSDTAVYHEVGDILFAVVNLARKLRVDPELALRSSSRRFRDRVQKAARMAADDGEDFTSLPLERQEEYYQLAKG